MIIVQPSDYLVGAIMKDHVVQYTIRSMSPLNAFWDATYAGPFHYVELLFAFLAAISFLVFLRGWLGGIGNVFKMNGHDGHLEHAYVRQVWGVLLLGGLFFVWEIVRTIASWIGFHDGNQTYLGYYFAAAGLVVWVYTFVKKNLFSGGGGH